MLKALFTLDYEIHGNGDGCPHELMVEPTDRMMRQFEAFGAKLTIMADIAEILRFKQYAKEEGRDRYHYAAIAAQLRDAIRRGHDVQLHIHASYFNARHEGGRWRQDWSEYNFAGLKPERLKEVVRLGRDFLESLLVPVNPRYRCHVFRAANWSVSPSANVVDALAENGFDIETSVFKYGRRSGLVTFDYTGAHSGLVPWRASDADLSQADANGRLCEFPIYSELRPAIAFLTPQRIYRACVGRLHKFSGSTEAIPVEHNAASRVTAAPPAAKAHWSRRKHAWKADFNQCGGGQLIRALKRAEAAHGRPETDLPFVLIGHSKLFTRYNEWSLRPFLSFIARHPGRFGFGRFADFNLASFDGGNAPASRPRSRKSAAPDFSKKPELTSRQTAPASSRSV